MDYPNTVYNNRRIQTEPRTVNYKDSNFENNSAQVRRRGSPMPYGCTCLNPFKRRENNKEVAKHPWRPRYTKKELRCGCIR
eukprot:UN15618